MFLLLLKTKFCHFWGQAPSNEVNLLKCKIALQHPLLILSELVFLATLFCARSPVSEDVVPFLDDEV